MFKHPVVEASFRLYHWRDSFDLILLDWTPLDVRMAEDVSHAFNSVHSVPYDFFSGQNLSVLYHLGNPSQLSNFSKSYSMMTA